MRLVCQLPRPRTVLSSLRRRFKRRQPFTVAPEPELESQSQVSHASHPPSFAFNSLSPSSIPPHEWDDNDDLSSEHLVREQQHFFTSPRSTSSVSATSKSSLINIDQLPQHEQMHTFVTGTTAVEDACPICLDPQREKQVTMGKCRHAIHTECIVKWFRYTTLWNCPVCRTPLVEVPTLSPTAAAATDSTTSSASVATTSPYTEPDEITTETTEPASIVSDSEVLGTISDISTAMLCGFDAMEEDLLQEFLDEIAVMSNEEEPRARRFAARQVIENDQHSPPRPTQNNSNDSSNHWRSEERIPGVLWFDEDSFNDYLNYQGDWEAEDDSRVLVDEARPMLYYDVSVGYWGEGAWH